MAAAHKYPPQTKNSVLSEDVSIEEVSSSSTSRPVRELQTNEELEESGGRGELTDGSTYQWRPQCRCSEDKPRRRSRWSYRECGFNRAQVKNKKRRKTHSSPAFTSTINELRTTQKRANETDDILQKRESEKQSTERADRNEKRMSSFKDTKVGGESE